MRVLVYPHELAIGGSQINAIDLAAEIRTLGHEAIVYAQGGPLESYITEEKGLRYVRAHDLRYRPAPTRIAQLARIARREGIDVIHAYEWPPCLDVYLGAGLVGAVPILCTVLSMGYTSMIPDTVPLVMGTEELAAEAPTQFSGEVDVMEPPIDTELDHPGNDGTAFRARHGITDDDYLVVSVSRISLELKLDALVDAVDAAGRLADRMPIRLLLVGSGNAEEQIGARADAVNRAAGREVVSLVGPMLDPRPAYASADAVVAMGSSALRAMAHAKPVVVQGERGFGRLFEPASAPDFFWTGMYGLGSGGSAAGEVADALDRLYRSPDLRQELGRYGREVVVERYSLRSAATRVLELYERTIATRPTFRPGWARRSGWVVGLALEARLHQPSGKQQRKDEAARRLGEAATVTEGRTT